MPDLVVGGLGTTPQIRPRDSVLVEHFDQIDALERHCEILLPWALWQAPGRAARCGARPVLVLLEGDDDVLVLKERLGEIDAIAIRFADFNDGRGYSSAVLLRQRLGYAGALRAVGDVLRDQLFYLLRCGFDQFEPRADKSTLEFVAGYTDFSVTYQQSVTGRALYRRREAAVSEHEVTG